MKHRSVLMIYTGGTIGMVRDKVSGSLVPLNFEELYHFIPVLENFPVDIQYHTLDRVIDSSDMTPGFWIQLAEVIRDKYELFDGFVILHGSDTMAYTASVLSFLLENLNKPVVLTGSQLPLGVVRTDGRDNIINAIEIASAYEDDTPLVPEVSICFENTILRGNRTTKLNAENFNAFNSGNYPALAEVGVHIKYNHAGILKPNFKKLKVHTNLSGQVAIVKLFPGMPVSIIEMLAVQEGIRIVIIETFGSGNAPTHENFLNALKKVVDRGKILFNVTQCKGGFVEMGKYATGAAIAELGTVSGSDITTESAIAKAMFLLGQNLGNDDLKRLLAKPLRGEMTV